MSFQPKFQYWSKRAKKNNDAAFDENGTPLYSERSTDGTKFAERLLRTTVKPNPQPPRRFNGPLTRGGR